MAFPCRKAPLFAVNVYNIDYLTHLAQPDYDRLKGDLDKAAALDTDLVAVMIHWGAEYKTEQNRYQEDLADFLISHGADLVLGGHSHVPQPLELLTVTGEDGGSRSGFVCYSLGNFISAQNDPLTDTTAVLTLERTRDNITGETRVTGCDYARPCSCWIGKREPLTGLNCCTPAPSPRAKHGRSASAPRLVRRWWTVGGSWVIQPFLTAAMNGGDGDEARIRFFIAAA